VVEDSKDGALTRDLWIGREDEEIKSCCSVKALKASWDLDSSVLIEAHQDVYL
jgi:hypothetical protein